MNIYTLLYIKEITNRDPTGQHRELYSGYNIYLKCINISESLCCIPETKTL